MNKLDEIGVPTETANQLEAAKNELQSATERYPTLEQLRARRLAKFGFEAIQKSPRVNSYSVSQDYLTTGVEIVGQLAEALSYRNVSLSLLYLHPEFAASWQVRV